MADQEALKIRPAEIVLPELPAEIFKLIIQCLEDDKPALVLCMRVSTTWNDLAAPVLYHTIVIRFRHRNFLKNPVRNPFYIPTSTSYSSLRTRGLSKPQCLRLIRRIEIGEHSQGECLGLFDKWATEMEKLSLESVTLVSEGGTQPHLWYYGCGFDKAIKADQAVLRGSSLLFPIPRLPATTGIVVFTPSLEQQPPSLSNSWADGRRLSWVAGRGSSRRPASITYIFLTHGPDESFYETSNLDPNSRPSRETSWSLFQNNLVSDAWRAVDTNEVIIVNVDSVNKAWGPARADLADDLQAVVNARRPADLDENTRFELRFLSMKEYLKEHDWHGVLKDEEVGAWLQH